MASLARTGQICKYFGTFFRMGILKKSRRTDMSYFSPPPGSQALCADFIVTEGWVDGWMGWDGRETFFFKLISRKLLTIFSNLFRILLECVSRYFLRKTQKKLKKLDFSKIFAKIGGYFFFRFFEHKFANFSKTTLYFFLIVFGPLRRLFKTSYPKKSKKK